MHKKHMQYHLQHQSTDLPDDIFKCKKCNSRFETNESLAKHMVEHEVKKNFVCETCGRVFTRHDYLYKHMLTHTGVKQHKCPHCDFQAAQRSSLTVHLRKHTGERPYSCDMCTLRCVSRSNLNAHRRRHLLIKNYECSICNKKFGYKVSLEEHIASFHERIELHPCEHCGATYSRIRGLRRHLATKHGKRNKQEEEKITEVVVENVHNDQEKEPIIKNLRYELKEGDLLMIKNPDCEIFMS
ncbi:hypothetical protein O3G_MSEX014189 [Manduca sexta]|uniref:C2H2-type domain-containing protein n=2 Tax=Manduca sexta TaxID=7130 RepID=A0A921ZTK8_MANSE|nr:hypothetical protein O3G_MSEX014189 [Manduca sexta]